MTSTVGIAELRRNLGVYLRCVANGERFVVTDRSRPVAELGPLSNSAGALGRLVADGRVARPIRRRRPKPLVIDADPNALGRALAEVRGDTGV
jgi:prevent-host-death family protein